MTGNTLKIALQIPDGEQPLKAKITKVFEPFTQSCNMLVSIESHFPEPNGEFILKLIDRRYATQLRQDQRVHPWTQEIESQYHQFILNGGIIEFLDMLDSLDGELEDDLDDVRNEAFISNMARDLVDNEVDAYKTLEDLQGKRVPRFFGSVKIASSLDRPYAVSEYTDIRGLLIEYVQGFPLDDLVIRASKKTWKTIGRKVMGTLRAVRARGIVNLNARARSFIVSPKSLNVRMINFIQCRFREQYGTEEEWRRVQRGFEDEETIGHVLENLSHGRFEWKPSSSLQRLQPAFKSQDTRASSNTKGSTEITKALTGKTFGDTTGTDAGAKESAKTIESSYETAFTRELSEKGVDCNTEDTWKWFPFPDMSGVSSDTGATKTSTHRLDVEDGGTLLLADLCAVPGFKVPIGDDEADEFAEETSSIPIPFKETKPSVDSLHENADIITHMANLDIFRSPICGIRESRKVSVESFTSNSSVGTFVTAKSWNDWNSDDNELAGRAQRAIEDRDGQSDKDQENRPEEYDRVATTSTPAAPCLTSRSQFRKLPTHLIVARKARISKDMAHRRGSGQSDSSNDSVMDRIFSASSYAGSDKDFLKEELKALES